MSPSTTHTLHATAAHLAPAHFPVTFLSPQYLWLMLLVPLAVISYFLLLGRRKRAAVRYGNFGMLKQAIGSGGRWRRHVPPALLLLAFTLMVLAIARPAAVMSTSSHKATVILAMDVSGSMDATDIKPSRIQAMQAAAKQFIEQQPRDVIIGIVEFAGSAFLVQAPTTDRTSLNAAIDRFTLQPRTAVGSGILTSLAALFPEEDFGINPFDSSGDSFDPVFNTFRNRGAPLGSPPKKKATPVEPGSDKSAVVVLLTDGATNAGPDPLDAARIAANHGVRVYTVGFGTANGEIVGYGGWRMRARLDEDALKHIADITRAQYFRADSAENLQAVYRLLSKSIVVETKQTEITALFTAGAAVLVLLSAGLSLMWFSRVL